MKAKHAILLLAPGYCLEYLVPLLHLSGASRSIWLFLFTACKVAGIGVLVYKVVTYPQWQKFLNS